jgi:hypothetical protein
MEDKMLKVLLAGAAGCALMSVAAAGAANAVPSLGLKLGWSLIHTVADQETESVDQDLRPEIYRPGTHEDATQPGGEMKEEPKGEMSGDVEDEEIKKDLRPDE